MELELSKEETEQALLEWVSIKWGPDIFKQAKLGDRYSSIGVTFGSKAAEDE
jgi:hypothetical protein